MTASSPARLGVGFWAWAGCVLAGLALLVGAGRVRYGGLVVGGGFVLAAVLRAVVPAERAGGLQVRSRRVDVALSVALGVAVAVASVLVSLRENR